MLKIRFLKQKNGDSLAVFSRVSMNFALAESNEIKKERNQMLCNNQEKQWDKHIKPY